MPVGRLGRGLATALALGGMVLAPLLASCVPRESDLDRYLKEREYKKVSIVREVPDPYKELYVTNDGYWTYVAVVAEPGESLGGFSTSSNQRGEVGFEDKHLVAEYRISPDSKCEVISPLVIFDGHGNYEGSCSDSLFLSMAELYGCGYLRGFHSEGRLSPH